jgi:Family of unknown function (DUF6325)
MDHPVPGGSLLPSTWSRASPMVDCYRLVAPRASRPHAMGWCETTRIHLTIDVGASTQEVVPAIAQEHKNRGASDEIRTDLVEYMIVVVPSREALAAIGSALAKLVENAKIRILDLVVLERDADGAVTVLEVEALDSMASLRQLDIEVGGMLSEHDLELAALALKAGMPGVVLVTEDLWAKSLSTAARRAGGEIIAGERIPASRVEAALGDRRPGN